MSGRTEGMQMQVPMKVQRVFAVLGLIWVIHILFHPIFPGAFMAWYGHGENLVLQFGGSLDGRASGLWLLAFSMVPASLILLAGIGVQSVIARAIRKARA